MASNGGSIFSLVVCAASVLSGCAANPPMSQVAKSVGCEGEKVWFDENNGGCQIARTCGKVDVLCKDRDDSWTSLRTRAAFDMSCPASDLYVVVIDGSTFGVKGCDQKATYKTAYGIFGFVSDTFHPSPASQQQYVAPPPPPPPAPVK